MQLSNIQRDLRIAQSNIKQPLHLHHQQTKYRWVVLALATIIMLLNGLLNNIVLPLQTKLTELYQLSSKVVNLVNIFAFLVFLAANLPANYVLDKRGIKFGLIIGNSLYLVGIGLCCFINVGFPFLIIGYLTFTMGQPFIVNIPAKLATYWFFPQNRGLATSLMVGANILGSGIGFAIPTLVVSEDGDQEMGKRQVFSLYLGYTVITFAVMIGNTVLMKSKPVVSPSRIDKKADLTAKETFQMIKTDRNLWKFFSAYSIFYGSFLIFGTSANFLIKPFGLSDAVISLAAVALILLGAAGAVASSIFLKKTRRYKFVITLLTFASTGILALLGLQFFVLPYEALTVIIVGAIGFFVVPIVPASYQIGCEVAFPIGQAQITGILNGGAFIWAFLLDLIMTAAIGFGSQTKSALFLAILTAFLFLAAFLYLRVDLVLKRKQFQDTESQSSPQKINPTAQQPPTSITPKQIQMTTTPVPFVQNYNPLNEQL